MVRPLKLPDLLCIEDVILHLIANLETAKATVPDNILARMLNKTASKIACSLFNLSLTSDNVPIAWKTIARVVPVPKSNNFFAPSKYQPISILLIMERCVYQIMFLSLLSTFRQLVGISS